MPTSKQKMRKKKEIKKDIVSVWTMNVQAVLLCPNSNASATYCKTKLALHNFTLYYLKIKEGYCYVRRWREATARGAMEKSWRARVIERKEARGDDQIEYFLSTGIKSNF